MVKNICKGRCEKYKPVWKFGKIIYDEGIVRCRTCYEFLKWEGLWCPCCNCRVSHRARSKESKSIKDKMSNVVRM